MAPLGYDELTRQTVLYDGTHTWILLGDSWQLQPTVTTPGAVRTATTVNAGMAYDPQSRRLLMYVRGLQPTCVPPHSDLGQPCGAYRKPQTWGWDGRDWHLFPGVAPDDGIDIALDRSSNRPLLLSRAAGACGTRTWLWTGARWVEARGTDPPLTAASTAELSSEPRTGGVLMVSATPPGASVKFKGCPISDTTWLWTGGAWHDTHVAGPAVLTAQSAALGPDLAGRRVLMVTQRAQTWSWNGTSWSRLRPAHAPSERIGPALCWDGARDRLLLVGGLGAGPPLQRADTWSWTGSDWLRLSA
jgi:hypothetical protein